VSQARWPELICVGQLVVGYRGKSVEDRISEAEKKGVRIRLSVVVINDEPHLWSFKAR